MHPPNSVSLLLLGRYKRLRTRRFFPSTNRLELVDDLPWRKVVGHVASGRTGAHDPPQTVEDFAQIVVALWGVLSEERKVRSHERPLFI